MPRSDLHKFIPISAPSITQREIDAVTNAVRSGWVSSLGEHIDRFESAFAAFCGTRFALATSNGTAALHLALAAHGISEGDEVILPDSTFVATANAARYTGATPVPADVQPDTLSTEPEGVRRVTTPPTRAVTPVHVFRHPS